MTRETHLSQLTCHRSAVACPVVGRLEREEDDLRRKFQGFFTDAVAGFKHPGCTMTVRVGSNGLRELAPPPPRKTWPKRPPVKSWSTRKVRQSCRFDQSLKQKTC